MINRNLKLNMVYELAISKNIAIYRVKYDMHTVKAYMAYSSCIVI